MARIIKRLASDSATSRTPSKGAKEHLNNTKNANSTNGSTASPNSQSTPTKKRKQIDDEEITASVKRIRFLEDRNEIKFFKKGSLLPPLKPSPCTPGRSILKTSTTSTPVGSVVKKKLVKKAVKSIKKNDTMSEESGSEKEKNIEKKSKVKKSSSKVVPVNKVEIKNEMEITGNSEVVASDRGKENESMVVESSNDDSQLLESQSKSKKKNMKKKKKKKDSKETISNEETVAKDDEENFVNDSREEISKEAIECQETGDEGDIEESNDDDVEIKIEELDISGKGDSSDYQMFTKEEKEKMKNMSPEEKTKFINARLYETCKGKKKSEVKNFLRNLRLKKKPHINVAYEIKKLWEELRMKKTDQERKKELGLEIISKIKGEMLKLVNGRDTSKVFQYLLCLDDPEITQAILDELSSHLLTMSRSKYGSFFVSMLFIKTKDDKRDALFEAFRGHIVKLYDIVFSAKVVDILYNQVANEKQKFNILCEFFGKEFIIFRQQDGFNNANEMFAKYPEKKTVVLKNLLATIKNCVGKKTASFDFTHTLIITYLDHCSKDQAKEVIELCRDKILDFSGKKDGVKIALRILYNSSTKERKTIIKSMTSLVSSITMDHNGYQLILGIFDQVDDTVLVSKTLVHELITHLPDIVKSHHGNVVLQYILQPRDPKIHNSNVIDLLAKGDDNEYSKKDRALRAQQLYDEIKDSLFEYVSHFGRDIFKNKFTANLLYTMFENNKDTYLVDRKVPDTLREVIYKKIADVIEEYFKDDEENPKSYKFLERNHQANFTINELLKSDEKSNIKLSSYLAKIDKKCFPILLKTRVGSNVISNMYKYGDADVKKFVKGVAPSIVH